MNDSCECRVKRAQLPSNQVFTVEIPTAILHDALAFARTIRAPDATAERRKPSKISEKDENLIRQLATEIRPRGGRESRIQKPRDAEWIGRLNDRQFTVSTCRSRAIR